MQAGGRAIVGAVIREPDVTDRTDSNYRPRCADAPTRCKFRTRNELSPLSLSWVAAGLAVLTYQVILSDRHAWRAGPVAGGPNRE